MNLLSELRRRNVFRMAILYVVAAWLVMQVAEVVVTLAALPDWTGRVILILLAVGLPIALILSWFYELTPEGISLEKDVAPGESITRVTGRRLDFLVISLLCAAVILFAWHTWWPSVPTDKSIAILPFENMSADPEQEYFSDGISEDLLNLLAQVPELRVISRSSSFAFKGKDVAIPTVAAQLNVAHVLEGSVRRVGNRVRITAQLIDARSDSHLWSESYDRELDDIFAVQDEISAAISDALKVELALVAGETVQPTAIRAASTDAYDAYLLGRELIRLRGIENVEEAVRQLGRSLRLDENFAPAHAHLAISACLLFFYGEYDLDEARRKAIPHLDRAQELEPDLAEAHGGRALLALNSGDRESAIEHTRKALISNPSYVDAMNWLFIALDDLGHYEEAEATVKQMMVIDPLSLIGRWQYALWLAQRGRIEEAHEMADQLLEQSGWFGYQLHVAMSLNWQGKIAEGLSWGLKFGRELDQFIGYVAVPLIWVGEYDEARRSDHDLIWVADLAEGRFDEAIRATQETMSQDPQNAEAIANAAYALYLAGRIDEALPLYERLPGLVPEGRPIGSEPYTLIWTMRLALARRRAGDEEGAQAAAQIVRQDHVARRVAGRINLFQYEAEAMIAAFDDDPEGVIIALKSAMQHGLRYPWVFDDPVYEDLRDKPRFLALKAELEAILAAEHDNVLQLICFNNPTPDYWQPLPETCEGVVETQVP